MINGLKAILRYIRSVYMIGEQNGRWRKINPHNSTNMMKLCEIANVSVGIKHMELCMSMILAQKRSYV